MKADSFSLFDIFQKPQRLRVPQYQRPYVWTKDLQWLPLWEDITTLALKYLENGKKEVTPHFLGAVVLQHQFNDPNILQERSIVDGQQRLTTLQILIDAVQAQMVASGSHRDALWLQELVENDERYRNSSDDMFKLLPTNRDLPGYREVMSSPPPINYSNMNYKEDRVVQAHQFFAQSTAEFLNDVERFPQIDKAEALRAAIRDFLRVVVISLEPSEDAQAIFETLNSRGTALSSADLIKNLLFQRLEAEGDDVAVVDEKFWRIFEKSFWAREVSVGRRSYSQSSIFLTHFLVSRTGEVIVAGEVFNRFKQFVLNEWKSSTLKLVEEIFQLATLYEHSMERASLETGELNFIELFLYRMQTMDTDSVRPLFLHLIDPALPKIPEEELKQALGDIESWLVRRALLRYTTKRYNRLLADLIRDTLSENRSQTASIVRETLMAYNVDTNLWPDDETVRRELPSSALYREVRRDRIRMILEAIEDDLRGYTRATEPKTEERCPRHILTIEHVMPQNWTQNWSLGDGEDAESRLELIQTIGNLTLIRGRLNSSISNSGWSHSGGKRDELRKHARLALSGSLESFDDGKWTHSAIKRRSSELMERLIEIWPTPPGHKIGVPPHLVVEKANVSMMDLISAGLIEVGAMLEPRSSRFKGRFCVVLSNGQLETDDGLTFDTPSGAGKNVANRQSVNGWWFWKFKGRDALLPDIRNEYLLRFHSDAVADDDDSEFDEADLEPEVVAANG